MKKLVLKWHNWDFIRCGYELWEKWMEGEKCNEVHFGMGSLGDVSKIMGAIYGI